ncbi:MAG: hypothetical protein ACRDQZ_19180 [Mycobacteriales bacterium]
MALILVDVEAVGISPINGKMTEFGAVELKSRQTFHGSIWESMPDSTNPAKPLPTDKLLNPLSVVMNEFTDWLGRVTKSRPIFVSDNPAYDFQWINAAFDMTTGSNPFGHSARRISDFYAGLVGDFYQTQAWKSLRVTPHDHNPVNDAMGNAEALTRLLKGELPDDA